MQKLTILCAALLILTGCDTARTLHSFFVFAPPPPAVTSGNVERGTSIFAHGLNEAPPCSTCHQVVKGAYGFSLGPNLAGVGARAATRIDGMNAEQYLHQSIVDPRRYIVSGYRDIMYPDFAKHLTEQDITDLIAYLMTL